MYLQSFLPAALHCLLLPPRSPFLAVSYVSPLRFELSFGWVFHTGDGAWLQAEPLGFGSSDSSATWFISQAAHLSDPDLKSLIFSLAAAATSLQSCLTLYDPIDGSPPGSPIPGILQARTLQWVAISFSNAWKWTVKVKSLSCIWLLATPWTAAHQAPPSMGFSRQEYWSGLPLPSPLFSLLAVP